MATRSRQNTTSSTSQTTKMVCCKNCLHACLIQYDRNPILADCTKRPTGDDKFPYDRDVASSMKNCSMWKLDPNEKQIEHRTHHKEGAA